MFCGCCFFPLFRFWWPIIKIANLVRVCVWKELYAFDFSSNFFSSAFSTQLMIFTCANIYTTHIYICVCMLGCASVPLMRHRFKIVVWKAHMIQSMLIGKHFMENQSINLDMWWINVNRISSPQVISHEKIAQYQRSVPFRRYVMCVCECVWLWMRIPMRSVLRNFQHAMEVCYHIFHSGSHHSLIFMMMSTEHGITTMIYYSIQYLNI